MKHHGYKLQKIYTGGIFMKKARVLRIASFMLALLFIVSAGVTVASAATPDSSITNATTDDIKELLGAISYNEYEKLNEYLPGEPGDGEVKKPIPLAEKDIILSPENWEYEFIPKGENGEMAENVTSYTDKNGNVFNVSGVWLPSSGTITWTTDAIKTIAKYNIVIEYLPVDGKATPIEKVLLINGEIPFAEARQVSMEKIWDTDEPYADYYIVDGKVTIKEGKKEIATKTVDEWIAAAKAVGITAYVKNDKVVAGEKKTVLRFEMPEVWNTAKSDFVEKNGIRFFTVDIDNNEIRSNLVQRPALTEYYFKDANGFRQDPFDVVLKPLDKDAINDLGIDDDTEVAKLLGKTQISLRGVNEPVIITKIRLEVPTAEKTYDQYRNQEIIKNAEKGTGTVKIEGEYFDKTSSQTIYPISDGTSAITSPAAVDRTLLNTVGGDKWQSAGQWIEYKFTVSSPGMYQIVPRFKQHLLDGMYTSRALYIYGGNNYVYNGLPFEEAGRFKFDYNNEWQAAPLSFERTNADGSKERVAAEFYFEKDVVYTIRFEVNLGTMGDIVNSVQETLDAINADYLSILKLTGPTPDEFRDYGFNRVMPDTMSDMIDQAEALEAIVAELEKESEKSSMTATLVRVSDLLYSMGTEEDNVAKNLDQLKTYIGSLGTWLSDAKTQPLVIDFISVQSSEEKLPRDKANIFEMLWFEIRGFIQSFFRNYDRMGAMTESAEEESVEVWLAYGRDQTQVIRGLINNDFTSKGYAPVNLKLVSGGTLLPSILSKQGPDVYIGLGQGEVINYAIRGALLSIDDIPEHPEYKGDAAKFKNDFGVTPDEFYKNFEEQYNPTKETIANGTYKGDFNEAAMMVLKIENEFGEEHCYGLPETQNFTMMFVREDILAELDIDIPKTWDDVKKAIPVLQANNMQIGMHNDSKIFLYQNGGELFADNGMRINLDSNVALDSFSVMCDFFTMYSFPYKYDFANRFRTGEMPIGFATYTATYNQLKVFATEIEGLWSFYPMPGVMREGEDGEMFIDNSSVSSVSAIVMIVECQNKKGAWDFMTWHAGADCQVKYSNEMVAILGPSAKHATANETALLEMPWTAAELEQLETQFKKLASIPNYPGNYIVDRYLKFAFLDAYDDNKDPAKSIEYYVSTINKEIARKRKEFNLETLDYVDDEGKDIVCPTLANKRLRQANDALDAFKASKTYNTDYEALVADVVKYVSRYETEDFATLRNRADALETLAKTKGGNAYTNAEKMVNGSMEMDKNNDYVNIVLAVEYMRDAASALEIYENYK